MSGDGGGVDATLAAAETAFADVPEGTDIDDTLAYGEEADMTAEDFIQAIEEPDDDTAEDGPDPEPDAEAGDDKKAASPGELGTEDNPYTEDNLPEMFVEISVDGEKQVVSIQEARKGIMMQKAFHKRANQAASAVREAKEYMAAKDAAIQKERDGFYNIIQNPQAFYQYMSKWSPDTFDKIAKARVQELIKVAKLPPAEQARYYQGRGKAAMEHQLKQQHEELRRIKQTREEEASKSEWLQRLRAPWREAVAEMGSPEMTPDMVDLIKAQISAKLSAGHDISHDTVKGIVRAAIKAYREDNPDEVKGQPPRKSQTPRKRQRSRGKGGRKPISSWDELIDF